MLWTPKTLRKTGASVEAQRYCSNTDPRSDHLRIYPALSKHNKRWKRERRFCYESECAILPFYPVFWSGCYQSGTPGGRFGLLPRALAGTDAFPLWKGNWNLKMSCNMHSLDVFQWTLTCYKEKKMKLYMVCFTGLNILISWKHINALF